MVSPPVVLLAFANEQGKGNAYLRNLPKELNGLKAVFERAEEAGLCEVEVLSNTTLEQIFDTFQKPKFKNRIAIFHFGGHADSFELLLESEKKATVSAHGEGVVPFLAGQSGLKLIFLNGCFTIQQAQKLIEQGISAVIGTVRTVEDQLATDLSYRFYKAISLGYSIERAWEEATYYIRAAKGDEKASEYYRPSTEEEELTRAGRSSSIYSRFPWEIHYRPGAERVKSWNLPEAAGNLLFGLPELSENYRLPDQPFHFLKRYTQKEAPLFFGRGREIRTLYQRITNTLSSPVILLYGQSGVGKSSLLEAGLLPRIEKQFRCIFFRRDPEIGLSIQLQRALGVPEKPSLTEEDRNEKRRQLKENIAQLQSVLEQLKGDAQRQVEENIRRNQEEIHKLEQKPVSKNLGDLWKKMEAEGLPLLLIADQAEEVFTRPNPDLPDELEAFLGHLQGLFKEADHGLKGKVLLSYRQEYHAQINKLMSELNIHREEAPVFRLDKKAIMEVVNGLKSSMTLQQKYNVEIEAVLPALIADDLLEDKHSPIAPVLQIILTKMWQKQKANPVKKFKQDDYQQLKREGILLRDFFDQQMAAIRKWEKEIKNQVESSGLALDILNFHVTTMVTADTIELDKLRRLYDHRSDILDKLIQKFQSLYLLTGLGESQTRLAHDTLAPIVQQKMRVSDYPGQRALRILESKMTDYLLSPQTTFIDEEDLKIVESGAQGMRRWLPREVELIEKSRKRRAALEAERRRNRRLGWIAVSLIGLLAVVVTIFWRMAEQGRRQAEANALYNQGLLQSSEDPSLGLKLIQESLNRSPEDLTKQQAYAELFAQNMFYEVVYHSEDAFLNRAVSSPDGRYLAFSLDKDNEIRLLDARDGSSPSILQGPNSPAYQLHFADSSHLLAGSEDRNAYLWTLPVSSGKAFEPPDGVQSASVRSLSVSADKKWLLTGHASNFARLWNMESGQLEREFLTKSRILKVAFHPLKQQVFLGLKNGSMDLFSSEGALIRSWQISTSPLTALEVDPQTGSVITGHENGVIYHWQSFQNDYFSTDSVKAHSGAIAALAFSEDGRYWLSASRDHTAKVWEADGGRMLYALQGHTAPLNSISILDSQKEVITAAEDSTIRRWDFPDPLPRFELEASGFKITDLCWTPDGRYLIASSIDRKVYVWDLQSKERIQSYSGHQAGVRSLTVSMDGKKVASGDAKGEVQIWELTTGQLLKKAQLHEGAVNDLCFKASDNDLMLASGGDDRKIVLWNWDREGLDSTELKGHRYEVSSVYFSPQSGQLISASLDSTARLWNTGNGRLLETHQFPAEVLQVSFADSKEGWTALTAQDELYGRGRTQSRPGSTHFEWATNDAFYLSLDEQACRPEIFSSKGHKLQTFLLPASMEDCTEGIIALEPSGQWVAAGMPNGKVLIWNNRRLLKWKKTILIE